jgi:hypothetical protein
MISNDGMEKIIDRYVAGLLEVCGEKNPIRRKTYETDVRYALEVMTPFANRYDEAKRHDIYAVDGDFKKALRVLHDAVDVLGRFGIDTALPAVIENPAKIEVECVMALIDTLRSLDAFWAEGVERFAEEVIVERFAPAAAHNAQGGGINTMTKTFIHRYAHDEIPEEILDEIAFEEGRLEEYLDGLRAKGGGFKPGI